MLSLCATTALLGMFVIVQAGAREEVHSGVGIQPVTTSMRVSVPGAAKTLLVAPGAPARLFFDGRPMEIDELERALASAPRPYSVTIVPDRKTTAAVLVELIELITSHGHEPAITGIAPES